MKITREELAQLQNETLKLVMEQRTILPAFDPAWMVNAKMLATASGMAYNTARQRLAQMAEQGILIAFEVNCNGRRGVAYCKPDPNHSIIKPLNGVKKE